MTCHALQQSDQLVCAPCALAWDVNDPDPPRCLDTPAPCRPRLLIIGHGRHGKDTVAELLHELAGYRFVSSSRFAAEKAVFPLMRDFYATVEQCYDDRDNHRELWFHAIRAYNLRPGPSLPEQIFENHDIYVGLRSRVEFEKNRSIFDVVVWVDRSRVLPPEPPGSNELTEDDADIVVNNNGTLAELRLRVMRLIDQIRDFERSD